MVLLLQPAVAWGTGLTAIGEGSPGLHGSAEGSLALLVKVAAAVPKEIFIAGQG